MASPNEARISQPMSVLCSVRFVIIASSLLSIPARADVDHLSRNPFVAIQQTREVFQGQSGEFAIEITPSNGSHAVMLRLSCDVGTGRATFEDGSTEKLIKESGKVFVHGVTSSDLPGALTLTAWPEGASWPAATAFFDVIAPAPEPHIYLDGLDVTGTRQSVIVGQRIQLNVVLHPGLSVKKQEWWIGKQSDYTGGFVHTPFLGGPQPVIREGSATTFYWVTPGDDRTVVYRLTLANGTTASASVTFDIDGPSSTQVDVEADKVVLDPGSSNSSVLGMMASGISFRARYFLPEGVSKNFIWVQVITSDVITVNSDGVRLHCVPKSEPVANFGAGLDTTYPYDTHNPTIDNPRIHLSSDIQQYSRVFHARMFLLWTSGLSNSIPVPLGSVDWSFAGEAVLKGAKANSWLLKSGHGGPDNSVTPFTRSHTYPFWTNLVPYTDVLTCN